MRVLVDGNALTPPAVADESLQALLDGVRSTLDEGRIVVAVNVDGEPLVGDELSAALAEPTQGEVSIQTAGAPETVSAAFREVASQLEAAGAAQEALAARLNENGVAEIARELAAFCGVWANCQKTLSDAGSLLSRDFGAFEYDGESVTGRLVSLSNQLRELRDAFDHRDITLAADLLQFEMPEQCATWARLMSELATEIERAAGN